MLTHPPKNNKITENKIRSKMYGVSSKIYTTLFRENVEVLKGGYTMVMDGTPRI